MPNTYDQRRAGELRKLMKLREKELAASL